MKTLLLLAAGYVLYFLAREVYEAAYIMLEDYRQSRADRTLAVGADISYIISPDDTDVVAELTLVDGNYNEISLYFPDMKSIQDFSVAMIDNYEAGRRALQELQE